MLEFVGMVDILVQGGKLWYVYVCMLLTFLGPVM